MKNILYTFLLVSSAFLLGSCSKDEDTDAPKIEVLNPEENQEVKIGSNLNMLLRFKDEYGVRFYSYEIFYKEGVVPGEFNYKKELNINGVLNEFEIGHSVSIPAMSLDSIPTATGDYVLRILAVDLYDNMSYVDRTIKIVESESNN